MHTHRRTSHKRGSDYRCWESPTVLDNVLIKSLLCLTFTSSCPALECINTLKQSHFLVRQLWSLSKWEYSDWTCLAGQNVTFFKVVLKINFKPFWVIYGKTKLGENWGMSQYLATNVTLGGGYIFFEGSLNVKGFISIYTGWFLTIYIRNWHVTALFLFWESLWH